MILRKKRCLREAAVPSSTLMEFMEAVPDISSDPEELYEYLERKRILESAIRKLSQKKKGAIELHFLQERSLQETARQLGVSLTVAKARVFHAKTALRKSRVLRQINGRGSGAQACRIAQNAARQTEPGCYSVVTRFGLTQADIQPYSYPQSGHGWSTASANRSILKRREKEGEQNETGVNRTFRVQVRSTILNAKENGHESACQERGLGAWSFRRRLRLGSRRQPPQE
jgi:hypothetical protein